MSQRLDELYESLETRYSPVRTADFESLVTPNGNEQAPFHRWFHMKEAFSVGLLARVLEAEPLRDLDDSGLTLLDPFAGSGTTVLSGIENEAVDRAIGVERNPFLAFLASAKATARIEQPDVDLPGVVDEVLKRVEAGRVPPLPFPDLSTLRANDYWPDGAVERLLAIGQAIDDQIEPGLVSDLARVCLAAAIEPSSHLRKDGRTLRYFERLDVADPCQEVRRRVQLVDEDLKQAHAVKGVGFVLEGDGRAASKSAGLTAESVDLAVFSPPYPNNIDYTEVYKLEQWVLGFTKSRSDWHEQRRQTVRSHASLLFEGGRRSKQLGLDGDLAELLEPLIEAVPNDRYERGRRHVINGYFDDLLATLGDLHLSLRPGGKCVIVVGNSLHGNADGSYLIAADLLISAIAELMGYTVDQVVVARRPVRRASVQLLRESVVFLTRSPCRHGSSAWCATDSE